MTYMGDSATNFNISEAANEDVTSGVTNRESKIFFNGYLENFDIWSIYLKPSGKECVLISFYVVVFAVSLTGNILSKLKSFIIFSLLTFCGWGEGETEEKTALPLDLGLSLELFRSRSESQTLEKSVP